jgi:hypothetical protein
VGGVLLSYEFYCQQPVMTEVPIELITLRTNEKNKRKYEEYSRLSPNNPFNFFVCYVLK